MKAERRLSCSFCFSLDYRITMPVARSIWSVEALLNTRSRLKGLRNRAVPGCTFSSYNASDSLFPLVIRGFSMLLSSESSFESTD